MYLFRPEEKVLHTTKSKAGRVLGIIGGAEKRYCVRHSGFIWSVPQRYLDSAPKKIKGLRGGKF